MGTRADFYVGIGQDAEWLGSIAWDGYEWAEDPNCPLVQAKTETEFRNAVANILENREDATYPKDGWPWPWEDSRITDYAYYWHDGAVHWDNRDDWPNMKHIQNVDLGKRSGLIVVVPQEKKKG